MPAAQSCHNTERNRSFVLSLEGRNVLLASIAAGFGHADPDARVRTLRGVLQSWGAGRYGRLSHKHLVGFAFGGETRDGPERDMRALMEALLGERVPRRDSRALQSAMITILDQGVTDVDAWLRDAPSALADLGCDRERMSLYLIGRLPN